MAKFVKVEEIIFNFLTKTIMSSKKTRKGTSRYKIRNWKEYEAGLIQRGSITFWVSEDIRSSWNVKDIVKQRGGQITYSKLAIETCLTLRILYNLPLRQTEGFVNSLFDLLNLKKIKSPDHTTMSRRAVDLSSIRKSLKKDEPIHILIDSTGLKICGEGEWTEEKHGKGGIKQWRKLHLAIDEKTREIVACILTTNKVTDPSQVLSLINQIDSPIASIKADGAYDQDPLRQKLDELGIKSIFPPRKDAILSKDFLENPTPRDEAILRINKDGREIWEYASGYSKRNLVENAMFRYKNNIGAKLRAKNFESQKTEVDLAVQILNKMTQLGMPDSVRI